MELACCSFGPRSVEITTSDWLGSCHQAVINEVSFLELPYKSSPYGIDSSSHTSLVKQPPTSRGTLHSHQRWCECPRWALRDTKLRPDPCWQRRGMLRKTWYSTLYHSSEECQTYQCMCVSLRGWEYLCKSLHRYLYLDTYHGLQCSSFHRDHGIYMTKTTLSAMIHIQTLIQTFS